MSRVSGLRIIGIRSFDSRSEQVVKFESPLTLIVGQNGCGKTTIIECLKYAFTGLQPPNSKVGGAFVHDPKLNGETQVQALVQVSFRSGGGVALTVSRRLELNVKKTTRSLKTLEGSLSMVRKGERTVISSRVAELDQILPQYLGVSTAIIDNVIFCHQDESFWPLSDPSTLKKKFDEIFEAQKYTKAITNIKDIQKGKKIELDKFKIDEQYARRDKDAAIKTQKKTDELSEQVEQLREKSQDLDRKIAHARKMANETWTKSEEFAQILGKLEGKRIEAQSKQSSIDDLSNHLEEVPETDEWLETTLAQFEARQAELEDEKQTKHKMWLEKQEQIKSIGGKREQKVQSKGKFEQEQATYEGHLARRRVMVREVAAKHKLREYEYLDDEDQVDSFLVKLRKISKLKKEDLDRARVAHTSQRRDAQTSVNKLTERQAALRDQRSSNKKQMEGNDREAANFQKEANKIVENEGNKVVAESRVEDLKNRLGNARKVAGEANWEGKMETANADLRAWDISSSKLNDELMQSIKFASDNARLNTLKQDLKSTGKHLETLLAAHKDRISSVIGASRDWNSANLRKIYDDVVHEATTEVATTDKSRALIKGDLERLHTEQNKVKKLLSEKEAKRDQLAGKLRNGIDGGVGEYDDALRQAEEAVDEAKQKNAGSQSMRDYFESVLRAAENDRPACRTCQRAFLQKTEAHLATLEQFKQRIRGYVSDMASNVESTDTTEAEAKYKRILDLGSVRDAWKTLQETDIPATKKELAGLNTQRLALTKDLEKCDDEVTQKENWKREVESINTTVASITNDGNDINKLTTGIESLSDEQSHKDAGRIPEEIREELRESKSKYQKAQDVISRLRTEQEQSRASVSNLEIELGGAKNSFINITNQLEKKMSWMARVEEARAKNDHLKDSIKQLLAEVEKLEPDINAAQAKYDDIDERATAKEHELSDDLAKLTDSINNLDLLSDQIQSYIDLGGPDQLGRVDRELINLQEQLDDADSAHKDLTREINQITARINDGDSIRRRYADNLRYRRDTRALAVLQSEIEELESHNAEVDRDRFDAESRRYNHDYSQLTARQAGLQGEMKSKDTQLSELQLTFETEQKDAPRRYKDAHINVEATKAAVEDLARYGGALDKAIMKYHSLKMAEINTIIEELWRTTYRGTDVDTIMIKAENETASSSSRRVYNYRVVMVKRGAEMDMRGRCSAGQKVLASIIIRLALAECFSSSCGLIALDEPTTNLDRENIESLAQSLKQIIEYRRQQSNFQLVVITHDETFLKMMDCSKFTENYYRVSRDPAQNSLIERQNIADVL